jgi:hypothetical protein
VPGAAAGCITLATGLEQSVEWYHHRKLVAEANELIVSLRRQVTNSPRFYKSMSVTMEVVN